MRKKELNTDLSLSLSTACSNEDRSSDPEKDAITAVFYCYQSCFAPSADADERRTEYKTGIIVLDDGRTSLSKNGQYPGLSSWAQGSEIVFVDDELSLFNTLEGVVLDLDPDVLTSFELQHGGWGYVGARYKHEFGTFFIPSLIHFLMGIALWIALLGLPSDICLVNDRRGSILWRTNFTRY